MQKLMKRIGNPNRKGFTLIELIIVIIILAILALIIIPQMLGMQDDAIIASCRANARITNSMAGVIVSQQALAGNTIRLADVTIPMLTVGTNAPLSARDVICPGPGTNTFVRDANGVWSCPVAAHQPPA